MNKLLASFVEQLIGKPYELGANGPDKYDCSSSVCYGIGSALGKDIEDNTADQLYRKYTVPTDSRARGVLIFYDWENDGKIDHVTVITDANNMVHASSSRDKLVNYNIDRLNNYATKNDGVFYYRMVNWSLFGNN